MFPRWAAMSHENKGKCTAKRRCASAACVSLTLPFHFSTMKLFTGLLFCSLALGVSSQGWFDFIGQAYDGKVTGG